MIVSEESYTLPDLQIFPINAYDTAPEFQPELTVLEALSGPRRFIRIYRLCYLERRSLDPSITSRNERDKVKLSSLCVKRVAMIQPIIKGLLEGHSGIPHFNLIECAINWIDMEARSAELHTLEGARKIYRDYTDHLRHRLRLSNVGDTPQSIGYASAQRLQLGMAVVCGLASELSTDVVLSWAIRIPQKKNGANELPTPATTADDHSLAYALHIRFFNAFSQAVLNNTTPPVVVELADLGFEDLIYYHKHANNARGWAECNTHYGNNGWMPFFYRREGVFEGKFKAFRAILAEHGITPPHDSSFVSIRNNNLHFSSSALRELANHATRHFGYLLLSEAGGNTTHLANINCQNVRLDRALGLASTRAIKGRANYEEQEQLIDIRFAQTTWKQYLRLRTWMAQQLETAPTQGLFLLGRNSTSAPYTLLSCASITQLPLWPKNAPTLATRPARKHRTVNLLEDSGGNIQLVAGMQSATPQTIERHYAFKNREEAAKVMGDYFEAQAKAAELRHKSIRPVRIIESGDRIHSGTCDAHEAEPKLIEGYEELGIVPRCSAPVTCIFCIYFGLHSNVEDLVRLLTIKLWVEIQSRLSSINIDDHFRKFAPYLNRIQQITEEISNLNGEISERMQDALIRFEGGERDLYWNAKINALLEMEGI